MYSQSQRLNYKQPNRAHPSCGARNAISSLVSFAFSLSLSLLYFYGSVVTFNPELIALPLSLSSFLPLCCMSSVLLPSSLHLPCISCTFLIYHFAHFFKKKKSSSCPLLLLFYFLFFIVHLDNGDKSAS